MTLPETHLTATDTVVPGGPEREDASRATRKGRPVYFLVPVLVLINVGAVAGQAGWFHDRATATELFSGWDTVPLLALALVAALSVELTGVYLSMEADEARRAGAPSLVLQLGAYAVGVLAGWLNWDHFRPHGTEIAVMFAGMSAASPVLWAIWSRARHRQRLAETGQATRRGVRLSGVRMFWHPIQSLRVMSHAAWEGVTTEDEAVRGWELTRPRPDAPVSPAPGGKSKVQLWGEAQAILTEHPGLKLDEVGARMSPPVSGRWLRTCRKAYEEEHAQA